jgi:hypothetical protein
MDDDVVNRHATYLIYFLYCMMKNIEVLDLLPVLLVYRTS